MLGMNASTLEEYHAVRNAVGFLDLSYRGKIEVTGSDRLTFLHAIISNDVSGLPDWCGRYGTLLTPTGKMVSDFHYYRLPDAVLIDLEPQLVSRTAQTLEKYIIMEEVSLKDVSTELAHFSLQGPRSAELLEKLFGHPGPANLYEVQPAQWNNALAWIVGKSEFSETGYEIVINRQAASSLNLAVFKDGEAWGVRRISLQTRNILRLEAGVPWYGVDMDETHYPMEARLDAAISLTKGCYVGQEVVARATNLGGVPKLLMGLKLRGEPVPSSGARVLEPDGKQIGTVTSAVFSPRLQTPIAFAYLKRDFASPGKLYHVEIAPEVRIPAEVVERFI